MNAPPFPTNPSVGESFGNWTWNGVRWVCGATTGITVITTVFTATAPYQPSPGLVSLTVECVGSGGSGGTVTSPDTIHIAPGGGGGAGGYSRKTLPAALVAGGVMVTVGVGGNPVTQGPTGQGGQPTSFGAFCVANGGSPGNNWNDDASGIVGQPGFGAPKGIGDLTISGTSGLPGTNDLVTTSLAIVGYGGPGGAGPFGGGAAVSEAWVGASANGYSADSQSGGGGCGGIVNQMAAGTIGSGGAGGSGVCIVTEYCWADADTGGDCLNPPINVNARVAVTHVPWTGPGPCPPGWGQLDYDGDG